MSMWTYITGVVRVSTPARTTEQAEYIVKNVLNHLPQVTGSEENMRVIISQSGHGRTSQGWDEFGHKTNNLIEGYLCIYDEFLLTVEGCLRDRRVKQTHREFIRWLCRMAKRISVDDICVKISDHVHEEILITDASPFTKMYEIPPRWVEQIAGSEWWKEIENEV